MKKLWLLSILTLWVISIYAQKDWKLYTNTSYMRDIVYYQGDIVVASWGGLEFYSPTRHSLTKTMTIMDGLKGNDIRMLSKYGEDELILAIYQLSVDRIVNGRLDVSISQAMGLSSLQIYAVHTFGTHIFLGGENGLVVFQKDENISFPVFYGSYNTDYDFRIVDSITSDDSGFIYLGTNAGISRVHNDSLNVRPDLAWHSYRLSLDERVTSLAISGDILGIATNQKLFYIDKNEFSWYTATHISPDNDKIIQSGTAFSQVKIYPTGYDHRIYAVYGEWDIAERDRYIPNSDRNSLLIYDFQSSTPPSILKYDTATFPSTSPVTNVYLRDNDLYLTTWGDGLYHLDATTKSVISHAKNNSIQSNNISAIVVDKNQTVWFADGTMNNRGYESSISTKGIASYDFNRDLWSYYNTKNSRLISNNILAIGIDSQNRKWFGTRWSEPVTGWRNGLSVFDDSGSGTWHDIIRVLTIRGLFSINGQVWVAADTGGMKVFNENSFDNESSFSFGNAINPQTIRIIDNWSFVGTSAGIRIRNGSSIPDASTVWESPLTENAAIYTIDVYRGGYSPQVWIASATDLIMYDMDNKLWYRYDTDIKRRVRRSGVWVDEQLYYSDEDRLWGAEAGTPSCLLVDPFDRVWIGTSKSGLAMYDIKKDRFYNYKTTNSPLVSNEILTLGYHPTKGLLYISTPMGVMTADIGVGEKSSPALATVDVYPNPYKPAMHLNGVNIEVREGSFPINSTNECRIFDFSGQVVRVLPENGNREGYSRFLWDGNNSQGKKCAPGIYFYLIKTDIGDAARGKIVLIR